MLNIKEPSPITAITLSNNFEKYTPRDPGNQQQQHIPCDVLQLPIDVIDIEADARLPNAA